MSQTEITTYAKAIRTLSKSLSLNKQTEAEIDTFFT